MEALNKQDCKPHEHELGHNHLHTHAHANEKMQADINAARQAYAEWKSNDPKDWDKALDEKDRISARNPRAWKRAMQQIDREESAQVSPIHEVVPPAYQPVPATPPPVEQRQYLEIPPVPPPPPRERIIQPGYAPQTRFGPPPPAGPAYDTVYNHEPEFHGMDLGIIKVGVRGGSLDFGVNVGLAAVELEAGQQFRVKPEFMPIGGPMHARADAGFGFSEDGVSAEVGAGANFFGINGDADFEVRLGRRTGVDGDVRGNVLPVHVEALAGASIGPEGATAYTGANTGIADVFDVRTGAHVDATSNPGIGAGVGLQLGDHTLDVGPSLDANGPRIHLAPGTAGQPIFYPDGTRDDS